MNEGFVDDDDDGGDDNDDDGEEDVNEDDKDGDGNDKEEEGDGDGDGIDDGHDDTSSGDEIKSGARYRALFPFLLMKTMVMTLKIAMKMIVVMTQGLSSSSCHKMGVINIVGLLPWAVGAAGVWNYTILDQST